MEIFAKFVILSVLHVKIQQKCAPLAKLDLVMVEIVSKLVQIANMQALVFVHPVTLHVKPVNKILSTALIVPTGT